MVCKFCKGGNVMINVGAAAVILGAAVATSKGLVNDGADAQNGSMQAQDKTQYAIDTLLTRDLTYAAGDGERNDARWDKIQSQLGRPAPSFTVGEWQSLDKDMKGGDIKSMRGEIVVIDFWGTWCPPCRAALPHTAKMHEDLADQDVAIIGICNTRGSETMASLATQLEAEFPMAKDVDDKSAKAYGVQWWPYYVVIDRDGIVRAAGVRPDKLDEIVGKLIKLQPKREKKTSTIAR